MVNSLAQYWSSMYEILGLIPSTLVKKKKKGTQLHPGSVYKVYCLDYGPVSDM